MWSSRPAPRRALLALVLGAILLASGLSGGRAAADTPRSPAGAEMELKRLMSAFDQVVFGTGLAGAMKQQQIAKWPGPVLVGLRRVEGSIAAGTDGSPTPRGAEGDAGIPVIEPWVRETIESHLSHLARLTGLELALVEGDGAEVDIRITLTDRLGLDTIAFDGVSPALMRQLRGPGRCFFVYWLGQPGVIQQAEIVINTQLHKHHVKHCLIEEITQSLGLPNDTDVARPSMFSDHDRLLELSPGDELLVRALYHPGVRPALGREAALWLVKNKLRQLLAERSTL